MKNRRRKARNKSKETVYLRQARSQDLSLGEGGGAEKYICMLYVKNP